MGNQFETLLLEVSRELSGTVAQLGGMRKEIDQLAGSVRTMENRFAALDERKKWTGKERRRIDHQLETGDHTFKLLREQIATAEAQAAQAVREVSAIRETLAKKTERPRGFWPKIKKAILEAFIPFAVSTIGAALVSGAAWLYYHFAFLAKLAEEAKKTGGHP